MASQTPAASALFAQPDVAREDRADGSIILRSRLPYKAGVNSVGHWLRHWAEQAPERTFLAERADARSDWTRLTYSRTWQLARAAGSWMLRQELSAERPLMILSDNSLDHAVLALGAMLVGIPVASISPAYSLMSADHQKLRAMIKLLTPGAIYIADTNLFDNALTAVADVHQALVLAGRGDALEAIGIAQVLADCDDAAVDAAFATVTPDTIARFLFTSGSTGNPKAVINTHRMLTDSQGARVTDWPFLENEPPVIVDWLPWSHTFGANHNFNLILRNGGSLYIDAGRPAPPLIGITVANIKSVKPTICFNVPRGYDMLLTAMADDETLRQAFFENVKVICYAAAALSQSSWDQLLAFSQQSTGTPTPMVAAWGSTETAPLATDCHFQAGRSGNIGVPAPGVTLKLVPIDQKLEVRVKGTHVTPGYWRQPEQTQAAFDDEGFYRIGDAVRLADPADPSRGLYFDGRIAEDFKLASGTFVHVGQLRLDGIAALAPIAQDIVVGTSNQRDVVFLVFPNLPACRQFAGLEQTVPDDKVIGHPKIREQVAAGLAQLKRAGGGSSRFATRARLLVAPPNVDAGEITDKGYINQRAVLANRATDLDKLGGDNPADFVEAG